MQEARSDLIDVASVRLCFAWIKIRPAADVVTWMSSTCSPVSQRSASRVVAGVSCHGGDTFCSSKIRTAIQIATRSWKSVPACVAAPPPEEAFDLLFRPADFGPDITD